MYNAISAQMWPDQALEWQMVRAASANRKQTIMIMKSPAKVRSVSI
jgi:hypothetical protein